MTKDLITPNPTHNAFAKSWVESANVSGCDFPIQNLPCAMFRRDGSSEAFRGGVAGHARIGFGESKGTILAAIGT